MRSSNEVESFMPLWIADYLADTTHLTTLQHGAYDLLLYAYWRRGGPLPDDNARLAAIAKMTPKDWLKMRPVMAEFFRIEDGHWHQKRAEEELAKARERLVAQRQRTEAATNARRKRDGTTNGNVTDNVTVGSGETVTQTVTSNVTCTTSPSPSQEDSKSANADLRTGRVADEVWRSGLAYLTSAGVAEKQARTLIGKWRRDHGDPELLRAIIEAEKQAITEPVAWLTKALAGRKSASNASNPNRRVNPVTGIAQVKDLLTGAWVQDMGPA